MPNRPYSRARMLALIAAAIAAALAGCGGDVEATVRDEYPDHAQRQGFPRAAQEVESVVCDNEATREIDGWCAVKVKGGGSWYEVPHRDGKALWGEGHIVRVAEEPEEPVKSDATKSPDEVEKDWDAYFKCVEDAQAGGASYSDALDKCVALSP